MKNKRDDIALGEELSDHFSKEIHLYHVYLNFLASLQEQVKHGHTDAMDELVSNISFSERDFENLISERKDIMRRVLVGDDYTVEAIKPFVSEAHYNLLCVQRDELNQLIDDVKHMNNVNKILLENAMHFTKNYLSMFTTSKNDAYNNNGKQKNASFKSTLDWSV